jgi:hypothetical protein
MAGGIGILHTDAVSTISMLKMYVWLWLYNSI